MCSCDPIQHPHTQWRGTIGGLGGPGAVKYGTGVRATGLAHLRSFSAKHAEMVSDTFIVPVSM